MYKKSLFFINFYTIFKKKSFKKEIIKIKINNMKKILLLIIKIDNYQ